MYTSEPLRVSVHNRTDVHMRTKALPIQLVDSHHLSVQTGTASHRLPDQTGPASRHMAVQTGTAF